MPDSPLANPGCRSPRITPPPTSLPKVLTPTLLILLNLSHDPVQVDASGIILKSTHGDREDEHITISTALRPAEGIILKT